MTHSESDIVALTGKIDGWLDPMETRLLYRAALDIPANGVMVEIGSYRGRSTVVLGYAAQERKGTVYAIDPYCTEMSGQPVTMIDRDHLRLNLKQHGLTKVVEIMTMTSVAAADDWKRNIDFLWIDGSHQFEDVQTDLREWSPFVQGKIALHDYNTNWPGVMLAVDEFIGTGAWCIVEQVDATVILERT